MQTTLREQQNELWEDILKKTEKTYRNPEHFWRQIKQLMGTETDRITYLLDPNRNKLTTCEAQAIKFKRHLEKKF